MNIFGTSPEHERLLIVAGLKHHARVYPMATIATNRPTGKAEYLASIVDLADRLRALRGMRPRALDHSCKCDH